MRDYLKLSDKTHFVFPIDGDYINERDGMLSGGCVELPVRVSSAPGCCVEINGINAEGSNGIYTALIKIKQGFTRLRAKNVSDGTCADISVYYLPNTTGKYRISSDDNILFLADITKNKDKYASIFDNPYLAVYKTAHDLYGAKVHLNVFYSHDRAAAEFFSTDRPDFDLSMMTDKFKSEWEANSDWLKLSFHARSEMPDKPYKSAAAETITRDFLDVRREVIRFAGESTFSWDVTTIHWGDTNPECVSALHDLGHKALTGCFEIDEEGEPLVAYYAPISLTEHIGERDFWRDNELGMTFGRIDRITNIGTLDEVMADMVKIINHPNRGGFVSIMIHEQYFYEDYANYLPDFTARVLEPAKLLCENGYKGCFINELLN